MRRCLKLNKRLTLIKSWIWFWMQNAQWRFVCFAQTAKMYYSAWNWAAKNRYYINWESQFGSEPCSVCFSLYISLLHIQGFSPKCDKIVRERLIEQGSNARLNPRLTKACKLDVKKFCPNVLPGQGRIIGCLKNVFVSPKNRLTDTCKAYIEDMMEHAAKEDIKYDSDLYDSCKSYVSFFVLISHAKLVAENLLLYYPRRFNSVRTRTSKTEKMNLIKVRLKNV